MKPVVSVIVPVYNTESYVGKCIQSILDQTFTDFELILINDGSSDKSGEICVSFKEKDKRIVYISQENKGASVAKNIALDKAKGEFVTFVDSDDYIKDNMIDLLLSSQKQKGADLTVCAYEYDNQEGNDRSTKTEFDRDVFFSGKKAKRIATDKIRYNGNGARPLSSQVCKLYRTGIIRDNGIRFDEGVKVSEDTLFNLKYVQHISSLYYVRSFCYYRVVRNQSASMCFREDIFDEIEKLFISYGKIKKKYGLKNGPYEDFFIFSNTMYVLNLNIFHEDNKLSPGEKDKRFYCFLNRKNVRRFWDNINIGTLPDKKTKLKYLMISSHMIKLWDMLRRSKKMLKR